jgi:phosphohistidine phosphatase
MNLYLIRHGLAEERSASGQDDERPLTEAGKKKTHQVAMRLLNVSLQFDLILTSPLVRARQTADILMQVGLGKQIADAQFLAPGGAIADWLDWFQSWEHPDDACLAVVGHEPDLSSWAEILLWGDSRGVITLKKAGVIGIELPEQSSPVGNSSLFWLTPPRLLL